MREDGSKACRAASKRILKNLKDEVRVAKGIEDSIHLDEAAIGEVRDKDLSLPIMERQASPLLADDTDANVHRPLSGPTIETLPIIDIER